MLFTDGFVLFGVSLNYTVGDKLLTPVEEGHF